VITADGNAQLGAEQEDSIVAAESNQHDARPLDDAEVSAVSFDDEWEQDVDELVSWTNTLDI